jgi:HSP20 family protein
MPLRNESLRELAHLKRRMNQLFDEMLQPDQAPQSMPEFTWSPFADAYEDERDFFVEIELPGVTIESVEVTVTGNLLRVSGERRPQREHTKENVHRIERYFGRFLREFAFPERLDPERVEASLRDGILLVKMPRGGSRRSVTVE